MALVALKVLVENPGLPPECTDAGWYQGNVKLRGRQHFTRLTLIRSTRSTTGPSWQFARPQKSEGVAAVGTLIPLQRV